MRNVKLKRTVHRNTWAVNVFWQDAAGTPYWLEADNVQRPALGSQVRAGSGAFPGVRWVVNGWYNLAVPPVDRMIRVYRYPLPGYVDPFPVDDTTCCLAAWFPIVARCRAEGRGEPLLDWLAEQGPTPFARLLQGVDPC